MSRGFFGGFSGGKFGNSGSKASDALKKNMMKKGGAKSVGGSGHEKTNYQDMMKEKIEVYKHQMMTEAGNRSSVHLPGTDPNQKHELSQSAKDVLEQMAERKARKEAKRKKRVEQFRGGSEEERKRNQNKGPINYMSQPVGGGGPGKHDPWAGTMWGKKPGPDDDWR